MKKHYGKIKLGIIASLVVLVLVTGFNWEQPKVDNLILYNLTTPTAYARFINVGTLQVWDDVGAALATAKDYDDTDVVLTQYAVNALTDNTSTLGGHLIAYPAALPSGIYDVLIYDAAAASASSSDAINRVVRVKYNGSKITEMVDF